MIMEAHKNTNDKNSTKIPGGAPLEKYDLHRKQ